LGDNKLINGIVMTVTGVFIGGPANMISAAITADLGRQEVLAASDQALSTVTGIVDGTGSFGAAIGQVLIPVIQEAWDDWRFVFYFFVLMVRFEILTNLKSFFFFLLILRLSLPAYVFYHYLFVNVKQQSAKLEVDFQLIIKQIMIH
jgi:sugar phosphate permease